MILQMETTPDEETRLVNLVKVSLMRARLEQQQAERFKDHHRNLYSPKSAWLTTYYILLQQATDSRYRARNALRKYEKIQGYNYVMGLRVKPMSNHLRPNFRSWDEHRITFGLYDSPSSGDTW